MLFWLHKYKIVFETIAASALAVMSIVVGVSQYKQMQLQNKIAEIEIAPHFILRVASSYNPSSRSFESDSLIVENKGAVAYGVTADCVVELAVKRLDSNYKSTDDTFYIHYYGNSVVSADGIGVLFRMFGVNNRLKFFELERSARELSARNRQTVLMDLTRYVKLSYTTSLGKRKCEYFKVNEIGGGEKIEEEGGIKQFQAYRNAIFSGDVISLDTLKASRFVGVEQ